MVTLNKIVENIAFKLDEQFNDTLKESITLDVLNYRSLFIRRDLERNPLDYIHFLQSICIELEEADSSYCEGLPSNCIVLRSKKPIAKPVRLKSNGRTNFHFVGTVHKSKSFTFTTLHEMCFNASLPLQHNVIYYGYMRGHLVIYNLDHICKILLEYIVEDPLSIKDCRFPDIFAIDLEFPLPTDMITEISNLIVREHREPITNGAEVNIEKND